MNDLRKAAEALLNHWEAGEYKNCTGYMAGHIRVLREALTEPEDPRITELTTLMAEPGVTGVIFEVHRGPLSKSIREFGECPCPTHVKGDVRIEVKEEREWVGLTDEEIAKADCVAMDYVSGGEYGVAEETITEFARAIEQVLKEKNS